MAGRICKAKGNCVPEVLETVVEIAVGIARQSIERRRMGALFVVGDEDRVLKKSTPLILDPLAGHPKEVKDIRNANVQGTIKELAKLDGAFIVSADGYVLSAARYIEASYRNINLPMGFGSRHMAAASISKDTDAVAVVVSESDGVVRIFDSGELVAEILSGIWELDKIKPHIRGKYEKIIEKNLGLTMIMKK
ncbi:MAG: diadenylate cyclase [Methanophagales archaeon]|nr:diadenylate cyclase [Methanophagales archaeon]MCW7069675.1 diadenylate cyclase [Methanophagales archaeon]MCW7072890.1 diadenylate cyclase [Methanophagales archaeon]